MVYNNYQTSTSQLERFTSTNHRPDNVVHPDSHARTKDVSFWPGFISSKLYYSVEVIISSVLGHPRFQATYKLNSDHIKIRPLISLEVTTL